MCLSFNVIVLFLSQFPGVLLDPPVRVFNVTAFNHHKHPLYFKSPVPNFRSAPAVPPPEYLRTNCAKFRSFAVAAFIHFDGLTRRTHARPTHTRKWLPNERVPSARREL